MRKEDEEIFDHLDWNLCPVDGQTFELFGKLESFERSTVLVEFEKCQPDQCPERIRHRMESIVFYFAITSQKFIEHEFFDRTISPDYHIRKVEVSSIKLVQIERNEVDANDDIWEPFSPADVHPFIDFEVVDLPRDTLLEPRFMTIHIELSGDHIQINRTNYTFFDLLGDVEALHSALFELIGWIGLVFFKLDILAQN